MAERSVPTMSRRRLIQLGVIGGVGLIASEREVVRSATPYSVRGYVCNVLGRTNVYAAERRLVAAVPPLNAANLSKFVDPLPIPSVLQPVGKYQGKPYYEIMASEFRQQLHRDLAPTTLWGYAGQFPGKTIEVRKSQGIFIKWINALPGSNHLLGAAYDPFLHGARAGEPATKIVTHVHGAHVFDHSDGHPDAWFTNNYAQTGPNWSRTVYEYENEQDATTLWYHDHALGQSRLNTYAGLAGMYLIRDAKEDRQNLPTGAYEIPLLIQDRMFDLNSQLLYPVSPLAGTPEHPGPWIPEFFGDTILVNGKVWPYLDVEPRLYRFRIVNGSNARFFNLRFGGRRVYQIASDQGQFNAPIAATEILLAPGERADMLVDFSGLQGFTLTLTNTAPDGPFAGGLDPADLPDPQTTGQIMQFRVVKPLQGMSARIPAKLRDLDRLNPARATVTRNLTLEEVVDDADEPIESVLNGQHWGDPIDIMPKLGATEIWNLINLTGDSHPMHVHLNEHQVLDRIPFDAVRYAQDLDRYRQNPATALKPILTNYFTGPAVAPAPNERFNKDTTRADPGFVTRIIIRFTDYVGRFVWHCHILEHEDNDMMGQFQVLP